MLPLAHHPVSGGDGHLNWFAPPIVAMCLGGLLLVVLMHARHSGQQRVVEQESRQLGGAVARECQWQHRSFHAIHGFLAVSMMDMLLQMGLGRGVLPAWLWGLLISALFLAVQVWWGYQRRLGAAVSFLWGVMCFELVAMVYMWLPSSLWVAEISLSFAGICLILTVLWARGWMVDATEVATFRTAGATRDGGVGRVTDAFRERGDRHARVDLPAPHAARGELALLSHVPLATAQAFERVAMSCGCVVMAYMFLGMQLSIVGG